MAVYIDASAAVKLVTEEPESGALQAWLADQPERISSALLAVELHRAAALLKYAGSEAAVKRVDDVVEKIVLLELDSTLLRLARGIEPPTLRSLDSIHLASALSVTDVDAFVTYDRALAEAAELHGFNVVAPRAKT